MTTAHTATPMVAVDSRVYLACNTGGFDLRGCPNAEELAAFIARSCNAHVDLVQILKTTAGNIRSLGPAGALDQVPMPYRIWLECVESALAKAGAA